MSTHHLKTWPAQFEAVRSARKRFEWRHCRDRSFEVGDTLMLQEWDPVSGYTGRTNAVLVTYLLAAGDGFDVPEGYCVMSITPRQPGSERAEIRRHGPDAEGQWVYDCANCGSSLAVIDFMNLVMAERGVLFEPQVETAVPMLLWCPECGDRHIDEGDFADKPHHTHSCQGCGMTWRPAIGPTCGVKFLPGFKNEA